MVFIFNDCNNQKVITKSNSTKSFNIPESLKEYKTNRDYIRVTTYAIDETLSGAKSKAINNAKAEIGNIIEKHLKNVAEAINYGQPLDYKWRDEMFTVFTRNTINNSILSARIVNAEEIKGQGDKYIYWVVMDIPKGKIKDTYITEVTTSRRNIKINKDLGKYRLIAILNDELNKN